MNHLTSDMIREILRIVEEEEEKEARSFNGMPIEIVNEIMTNLNKDEAINLIKSSTEIYRNLDRIDLPPPLISCFKTDKFFLKINSITFDDVVKELGAKIINNVIHINFDEIIFKFEVNNIKHLKIFKFNLSLHEIAETGRKHNYVFIEKRNIGILNQNFNKKFNSDIIFIDPFCVITEKSEFYFFLKPIKINDINFDKNSGYIYQGFYSSLTNLYYEFIYNIKEMNRIFFCCANLYSNSRPTPVSIANKFDASTNGVLYLYGTLKYNFSKLYTNLKEGLANMKINIILNYDEYYKFV